MLFFLFKEEDKKNPNGKVMCSHKIRKINFNTLVYRNNSSNKNTSTQLFVSFDKYQIFYIEKLL